MVDITPAFDNIIIEKDDPDEESAGGILLPENRRKQQAFATVIAVGPGRVYDSGESRECFVKPGDRIVIRATAGQIFSIEGVDVTFIREDEIVGVIDG